MIDPFAIATITTRTTPATIPKRPRRPVAYHMTIPEEFVTEHEEVEYVWTALFLKYVGFTNPYTTLAPYNYDLTILPHPDAPPSSKGRSAMRATDAMEFICQALPSTYRKIHVLIEKLPREQQRTMLDAYKMYLQYEIDYASSEISQLEKKR